MLKTVKDKRLGYEVNTVNHIGILIEQQIWIS